MLKKLLAIDLLIALAVLGQTWGTWNGKTVGSSAGNVSSLNGKTIGTSSGNYNKWNTLNAPGGGGGGYSVVQATTCHGSNTASTNTATCTFGSPVTAGNMLYASTVLYNFDGTVTETIADDCTDTFHEATVVDQGNSGSKLRVSANYAYNITGGTCTVTMTSSANDYIAMNVYEVSGTLTTDPLDQTGTNIETTSQSTLTVTTGSTISQAGEIVFVSTGNSFASTFGTGTLTNSSDYALGQQSQSPTSNTVQVVGAFGTTTSAGTLTGTITAGPALPEYVAIIVTFK